MRREGRRNLSPSPSFPSLSLSIDLPQPPSLYCTFYPCQVSAVFSMKISQFNMKIKHFSRVLSWVSLKSSGGEILSDVEILVNILLPMSVPHLCVMYTTIAATSTTAVLQLQSMMYSQLGTKRGDALRFKASLFFVFCFLQCTLWSVEPKSLGGRRV